MRVGVVVPQVEIASQHDSLGAFVEGAEELDFAHLLVFDHVVGASREARPGWDGLYDLSDPFHEPFILLAWIAARTRCIGLATGVLVLPQRQTVLVAKQAAELDLLSHGRLRLGVGVGWNEVEYESLGMSYPARGRRIEEQIRLLRQLWTEHQVTFQGTWDHLTAVGLNPGPVQRPIPVWMGGSVHRVLQRVVALADGWMPMVRPDVGGQRLVGEVRAMVQAAGRDSKSLGLEARLTLRQIRREDWLSELLAWDQLGATHVTVNTSGLGLSDVHQHLALLRAFRDEAASVVDWEADPQSAGSPGFEGL